MSPTEHVEAMEAFVEAHAGGAIGVADIAAAAGLHPSYASVLYRRVRGATLVAHLRAVRVRMAVRRLSDGASSVAAVAFDSGFGSVSAFYEAFARVTGRSPGEFRRGLQAEAPGEAPAAPVRGRAMVHAVWVDDEPLNNIVERRTLGGLGVLADSYRTNDEAKKALGVGGYGLVITDVSRQPGAETGWDLARDVRKLYPGTPVLFYCGFVDSARRSLCRSVQGGGIFDQRADLVDAVKSVVTPERE